MPWEAFVVGDSGGLLAGPLYMLEHLLCYSFHVSMMLIKSHFIYVTSLKRLYKAVMPEVYAKQYRFALNLLLFYIGYPLFQPFRVELNSSFDYNVSN